MKTVKLYNMIFPIWFLIFLPPVAFIMLFGNFIIDSIVVIACYYFLKLNSLNLKLKEFYKSSIFKVWGYGFLADIIGASILFIIGILGSTWKLPEKLIEGINFNPFSNIYSLIIIIISMLISGFFIFFFNYKFTFKSIIEDDKLRMKISIIIAIITIPYTFLLPTKWFY